MEPITLLFSRSRSVVSLIVRMMTGSHWSHVALVRGDEVIEAAPGHGVRVISYAMAINDVSDARLIAIPGRSLDAVWEAMRSQVGKPYDWPAVFGIVMHRDWQDDSKWFCSELIAWAFAQAGDPLFRDDVVHRITPEHLWMFTK